MIILFFIDIIYPLIKEIKIMQKIENRVSNINKQYKKVLKIESKKKGGDFLVKNSFQKVFLNDSITKFIKKVTDFFNGKTLNSEEIISLKKDANRLKDLWIPLFSNQNKDTINNYLNSIHCDFLVLYKLDKCQNPSLEIKDKSKSLSIYFLYRNITEEYRYRNSIRILAKHVIPHLDRAYSLNNKKSN